VRQKTELFISQLS